MEHSKKKKTYKEEKRKSFKNTTRSFEYSYQRPLLNDPQLKALKETMEKENPNHEQQK